MTERPFIVGIGGTTRSGSTSERALLAALARAEALGCETQVFAATSLPFEPYDPGRPERSPQAQAMVAALRRANGLILSTPTYHGGISGLVKNAIDYVEDLREAPRPYLEGRAVGCIVCADGAQAIGSTLMSLRAVVHALRGWPTPYGASIASRNRPFGAEGVAADPAVIASCEMVASEVVAFARMVRAAAPAAPAAD
jgi:FMN reductase